MRMLEYLSRVPGPTPSERSTGTIQRTFYEKSDGIKRINEHWFLILTAERELKVVLIASCDTKTRYAAVL